VVADDGDEDARSLACGQRGGRWVSSSLIRFYNRRRAHFAADGRPPITHVQQVHEHNS